MPDLVNPDDSAAQRRPARPLRGSLALRCHPRPSTRTTVKPELHFLTTLATAATAAGPALRRRLAAALWAAAVVVAAIATPAGAAEPPKEPILRLEAGMHVNIVRDIAVDAAGRWAVTASDDKTARVWSVADGSAGAVLRVPIAEGLEGRLQAVAITPDGASVAVAGRTGSSFTGSNAVFVFDRITGALQRRIDTGSAAPVVTMALSPDARLIAVGLGGDAGVRVFDFASGQKRGEDSDYGDSVYALHFGPGGQRLVTGAADGGLRLYATDGGQLQRVERGRPEVGRLIAQTRFSPDGKLIAVSFEDAPQVLVLDAASLAIVGTPKVDENAPGAFSSLAWTADGKELWGGGRHRIDGRWHLRVWPRDVPGGPWQRHADRPVADASVLALATLPGQRVLYVSGEPAWGYIDNAGQPQARGTSPVASFNSLARQFQVSADGKRVRFWFGHRKPLFEFDLAARGLKAAEGTAGFSAPRTEAPGLTVEGWENGRGTTLNGQRLPLGELETARALSIAADGSRFAIGTDEGMAMFAADGRALWARRMPALVWAVNLSADGKLLVAAGQDGVIRWHRASDGAPLLALVPHSDQRRWVLWTPSGYYDAAAGAEELLGWHVNRSAVQRPDFYPAWTLRSRLRRADIIDRVLDLGDEAQAVRQANAAAGKPDAVLADLIKTLPPVLELTTDPQIRTSSRELRLKVRVRTLQDSPVTALRVRADGRPATVEVVAPDSGGGTTRAANFSEEKELRIRFGGQPAQLQLLAENKHGLSAPALLNLVWTAPPPPESSSPAPPPATATSTAPATAAAAAATTAAATGGATAAAGDFKIEPRLYILAIGVGKFVNKDIGPLEFPGKDVRDFVASMQKQKGKLYRSVEARTLYDDKATRDSIVDGLDWLERSVTQHDVGMLFVSGHGHNDPTLGYVYIPHNTDFESMRRTTVNMQDFKKTLDNLAGKALFFIDTCHSGNVLGTRTRSVLPNDVSGVINELISAESGVVVFSASTGRQVAFEKKEWGNGAFTKAIIEGLSGKADYRKSGRVTHKMLDVYVSERVKELTSGRQSPVTQAPGGVPDFPLAVVR